MIAKTLTYDDYDGNPHTDTVHFHLSKNVITDNMDLEDQFREVAVFFEGGKREMTSDEVKKILELIKRLIKLGYGVRSEDGQHFRQSEERYADFHDSAAYDALLWDMFTNPEDAVVFMQAILPQDLVKRAEEEMAKNGPKVPQDRLQKQVIEKREEDFVKRVPFNEPASGVTLAGSQTEDYSVAPNKTVEQLQAELDEARRMLASSAPEDQRLSSDS